MLRFNCIPLNTKFGEVTTRERAVAFKPCLWAFWRHLIGHYRKQGASLVRLVWSDPASLLVLADEQPRLNWRHLMMSDLEMCKSSNVGETMNCLTCFGVVGVSLALKKAVSLLKCQSLPEPTLLSSESWSILSDQTHPLAFQIQAFLTSEHVASLHLEGIDEDK